MCNIVVLPIHSIGETKHLKQYDYARAICWGNACEIHDILPVQHAVANQDAMRFTDNSH